MKIATTIVTPKIYDVLLDTLDSVVTYVGKDVLVIYDAVYKHDWGNKKCPSIFIDGFEHGCSKNPYKNVALGLLRTYEKYPNADWYCFTEYDCLFVNSDFKKDLKKAEKDGYWMLGCDLRADRYRFPIIEKFLNVKFNISYHFIGCCLFFNKIYIKKLIEVDFFNKLLFAAGPYTKDYFPGIEEQGIYDLSEEIYPTMAVHYGGKVGQFSSYNQDFNFWRGEYKKYHIRFKPDISEFYPESSIIHPLKEYNSSVRDFYRIKRKRYQQIEADRRTKISN